MSQATTPKSAFPTPRHRRHRLARNAMTTGPQPSSGGRERAPSCHPGAVPAQHPARWPSSVGRSLRTQPGARSRAPGQGGAPAAQRGRTTLTRRAAQGDWAQCVATDRPYPPRAPRSPSTTTPAPPEITPVYGPETNWTCAETEYLRPPRFSCFCNGPKRGASAIAPSSVACQRSSPAADASRSTTKSPSISKSIRVRRKQSKASSGRQTTGSFSLKEVFSTIGSPVRSRKASISR